MVNLGAHWPKRTDTDKDARYRINSHWKNLEPLWRDRRESVVERLAGDGLDLEPRLEKHTGGGSGIRTRYSLQFFPVPASARRLGSDTQVEEVVDQQSLNVDVSPTLDTRGGKRGVSAIRYYAVPMRLPGSDTQQPIDGITMGSLMLIPIVAILTVLIFLVIGAFQELYGITSGFLPFSQETEIRLAVHDAVLNSKIAIFLALALTLNLALWMIQLERNLVNVPPLILRLLHSGKAKILFELHYKPDDRRKQRLHILSYVADCPICGADGKGRSSIGPVMGGREFHGRIVGRCANAPQEHVWSFDHITRTGRFLR